MLVVIQVVIFQVLLPLCTWAVVKTKQNKTNCFFFLLSIFTGINYFSKIHSAVILLTLESACIVLSHFSCLLPSCWWRRDLGER